MDYDGWGAFDDFWDKGVWGDHGQRKRLQNAKKGPSGEVQSLEQAGLAGREDKLQASLSGSVEHEVFLGDSQKHLEEGTYERTRPPIVMRNDDCGTINDKEDTWIIFFYLFI